VQADSTVGDIKRSLQHALSEHHLRETTSLRHTKVVEHPSSQRGSGPASSPIARSSRHMAKEGTVNVHNISEKVEALRGAETTTRVWDGALRPVSFFLALQA